MSAKIYDSVSQSFKDAEIPKIHNGTAYVDSQGMSYDGGAWKEDWNSKDRFILAYRNSNQLQVNSFTQNRNSCNLQVTKQANVSSNPLIGVKVPSGKTKMSFDISTAISPQDTTWNKTAFINIYNADTFESGEVYSGNITPLFYDSKENVYGYTWTITDLDVSNCTYIVCYGSYPRNGAYGTSTVTISNLSFS